MIALAAAQLVEVASRPYCPDDELRAAAQEFFDAARDASLDEVNSALRTLCETFDLPDASRAGFVALACGAMIERGCDPMTIAEALLRRIGALLKSAATLTAACVAELPEPNDDQDPDEVFEATRLRLAATMPDESVAWDGLKTFWRPTIAVLSRSKEARAHARPLVDDASKITDFHEAGHWLRLILSTLDDEPILVIEPATRLGIVGRISGIVDNFQLHVLLMDCFPNPGWFARRRVPAEIAAIFRGDGPQQAEGTVVGAWNLHAWQAIGPGGTLSNATDIDAREYWIWNEGTPSDIPVWDGRRVILLGPPSYQRMWGSQRTFEALGARLDIERELSKSEVRTELDRMFATKASAE